MDYMYLVILFALFAFSIVGLIVGVSNDAVNFLNSGIGAKVASFKILMVVASLGIMIGAVFSGGMMEVARSGVFQPAQFSFHEIMLLFLAVMVTNILLLDFFNTLGLPTSTTVALVFALLGSAFAMSVIKINVNGEGMAMLGKYINTGKAFAIVSAIFISVAIAFTIGFVVMFISRIIFSFRYSRYFHVLGSMFGGLSISIITYFIFIKGLKDVTFLPEHVMQYIFEHSNLILLILTLLFFVIFEILLFLIKINIFKVVVLYGTFALALSFAGNDLVNFIGVPVAGYVSYLIYSASGTGDPHSFSMELLAKPVETEYVFLIMAGIIMAVTLWFSKKARTVVATTVNLSKQNDGDEQFDSNQFARVIVKIFYNMGEMFSNRKKGPVSRFIASRFIQVPVDENDSDPPAFDMVRAALNLMVASTLIAFGTSLKLPLSTTYVTFMVAMGTSLADKAWGRESAVYRVSGVFTVIGGWFITAFIAFIFSAVFAFLLWLGGIYAVLICIPLVIFVLYRTNLMHKRKEIEANDQKQIIESLNSEDINLEQVSVDSIHHVISSIPYIIDQICEGLKTEDIKMIKKASKKSKSLDKQTLAYKNSIGIAMSCLDEAHLEWGEYYLKVNENLRGLTVAVSFIAKPSYQHLNNLHQTLSKNQLHDLDHLKNELLSMVNLVLEYIAPDKPYNGELLQQEYSKIQTVINVVRLKQIQRIRSKETPSRSSLLFLNIISELKVINQLLLEIYEIEKQRLISKPF